MRKYATSFGITVVLLATIACDGDGGPQLAVNPTPIGTMGASRSVSIQASDVATERVPNSACPTIPPFIGSVGLNVQAVDFPLSLSLVRMVRSVGNWASW